MHSGNGASRILSVRAKLLIYFACFAAVMLLIIWVFQVRMLDYFYRQTKMDELSRVSHEIETDIESDELKTRAVDLALTYDTCVRVFKASSGHLGSEIVSADVAPTCLIHHLPSDELNNIYQNARSNGGSWSEQKKLIFGGIRADDDRDNAIVPSVKKGITAVSARIVSVGGNDYVIILNTEFVPMTSTVRTLGTQFGWIAAAVLIAAALLSVFFSEKISKPLTDMNRAAKKLAEGEYDTNFVGEGYLETHELASTLNYAAGEIARSDGLQRELIANVSHDLRTPLTMISR